MPFNSFTFVLFFAAVLIVHSLPLPWVIRKFNLLVASYLFYAAWDPRYVLLLLFSTLVNGVAARLMQHWDGRSRRRRALLWIAVFLNVGLLAGFKYRNKFLSLWQTLSDWWGIDYPPAKTNILLPIGLSFFTFQTMS